MIKQISKSSVKFSVFSFLIVFVLACSDTNSANTQILDKEQIAKSISIEESANLISKNKNNDQFVLLDIRTPNEYIQEHLQGAVIINFYAADFIENLKNLDKTKTYLIYCRTANRTGKALVMMRDLGFNEVYNMLGGIVQWKQKGFSVVSTNTAK